MIVNFTARHLKLTDEIQEYCQKRLERMTKLLHDVQEINIILSEQKNRKRADLQVKRKGEDFVVSEETNDLFNSMNQVFDSLEKKIVKERRKLIQRRRRSSGQGIPETAVEPEEMPLKLVRVPFFSDKPISIEEAVLQLEEGKKEIFMFKKEDGENWAAVFRRKDGQIGLVDPEG